MEYNLELAFQALPPALVHNYAKKPLALCSGHLLLSLFTVAHSAGCSWHSNEMSSGQSAKYEHSLWGVVGESKALQMCLEMFSAKCSLLDHEDYVEIVYGLKQGFGSERVGV